MRRAPEKVMEQLKRGNPGPYVEHMGRELDRLNKDLHDVEETIYLGRLQGEAGLLDQLTADFHSAGIGLSGSRS